MCDAGFSGSEFGVQGTKLPYTEEGYVWQVRNPGQKLSWLLNIFHRNMPSSWLFWWRWDCPSSCLFCKSPSLRLHFRKMLATTSSSYRTSVSLLPKHLFVSNGVQGHCFDTMSLLRLTLLQLGNVAPISVCLNARPKMGPGAARPLCPLCILLLWLDIRCC